MSKKNKEIEEKFVIGDNAKVAIVNAVSKMVALVGTTMGPAGNTVIIPDNTEIGKYKVTKDGVSVAKAVKSENRYEQVIIDLIKEVANNTVKIAGDGTTTSIVLMGAFMKHFLSVGNNKQVFELFDKCIEETLSKLDEVKEDVKKRELNKVALVSCNGDETMANLIHDAYSEAKVVHVKRSNRLNDKLEVLKGVLVPSDVIRLKYQGFIKNDIKLNDALVVAVDQTITKFSFIKEVAEKSMREDKPLIVITHAVHDEVLDIVKLNNDKGLTNVFFIKAPGFSTQRTALLTDIATYCGCAYVPESESKLKAEHVGTITSAVIEEHQSTLYNDKADISELISELESKLDNADEHTTDLINQRLDRLKGISIIHVGASSEAEANEKYDRYEDAVLAVACALEEGIVEGGGLALARFALEKLQELGYEQGANIKNPAVLFYLSLLAPTETILANGAKFDINTNLLEQNIYDPVKVTKTALVQSYNFVKLLLTTNSIILTKNEHSPFTV